MSPFDKELSPFDKRVELPSQCTFSILTHMLTVIVGIHGGSCVQRGVSVSANRSTLSVM